MTIRAKELGSAHWGYLSGLLAAHDVDPKEIARIKFHYEMAFAHGHGHGVEDADNRTAK